MEIYSVGFKIPGHPDSFYIDWHNSSRSLFDADVLIIWPSVFEQREVVDHWGIPDEELMEIASREYYNNVTKVISDWKNRLLEFLNSGKNIIVVFRKYVEYSDSETNYSFLPFDMPATVSQHGKKMTQNNTSISNIYWSLNDQLEYQSYLTEKVDNPLFFVKGTNNPTGAIFKIGKGSIVLLPPFTLSENFRVKRKVEEWDYEDTNTEWSEEGIAFGKRFIEVICKIDKSLKLDNKETIKPEWLDDSKYFFDLEHKIVEQISNIDREISKQTDIKARLRSQQSRLDKVKGLLFEQGTPLEDSVNESLKALGYNVSNYKKDSLEIDHIISSPENDFFIAESVGINNGFVDSTKVYQLHTHIDAYLHSQDEILVAPIGILFVNGFRLTYPNKRSNQFAQGVLENAQIFRYILIQTIDLFNITKYVLDSGDIEFAKKCREVIKNGQGKIVEFPPIPSIQGNNR